jgi:hypothetical protein
MTIVGELLASLPAGRVQEVRIGAFWTAVVAEVEGLCRCGLASTLHGSDDHHHGDAPAVREAGQLAKYDSQQLAGLAASHSLLEASVGMAAINALLPVQPSRWVELNADEVILKRGAGKRVAIIGHFPFVPRLQGVVETLWVLEKQPHGQDLPADAAAKIIPQADVVAITGTTLINHTFEEVIGLCRREALVLVLGPSTPLSPILFEHGVHILSGAVVEDTDAVLRAVSQGANFRQVHRHGVRLVTITTASETPS